MPIQVTKVQTENSKFFTRKITSNIVDNPLIHVVRLGKELMKLDDNLFNVNSETKLIEELKILINSEKAAEPPSLPEISDKGYELKKLLFSLTTYADLYRYSEE